jgi:hypothetical protein
METKIINDFTKKYSLTKTLRNELEPLFGTRKLPIK